MDTRTTLPDDPQALAELAANVNGQVQIERSELGGARFRLELPGW